MRSNTSNPARVASGGVQASSRSTITLDGDIQGSKVDTTSPSTAPASSPCRPTRSMARSGPAIPAPATSSSIYDSRDGQTYMRNGSGYSLVGVNLSAQVGQNPNGPITIDKTSQSAKASTQITYKLNLPTEPTTTSNSKANPTVANANIYNPDWPTPTSTATTATLAYTIANTAPWSAVRSTTFSRKLDLRWFGHHL